jgi:dTDP-4-dehydrorhamnose reductase
MTDGVAHGPLELWGGIECTINRLGDRFIDQLELIGGYSRVDLVEKMAAVGFTKVRWPALWEHTAPEGLGRADWRWCDATLPLLRDHGIEPIIGLVHHGSGPTFTDLLDDQFGDKLAEYATAFARRYPWVRLYTPINEPLTTARFSGLYGHWYPHRRDDSAFVAALINQTRATIKAMAAIRAVTPEAQLVCTEDAGSTRGTEVVAAQARFEDERRWLSLDLLTGRVSEDHVLWPYLRDAGMSSDDREWFAHHGVTPAIIGLNYYVTSDRFLDHQIERYPSSVHGGNGAQRYADVEAARVEGVGIRGHAQVLLEAWQRYGVPLAITEAHLGCSREEQMRWLRDAWMGAVAAREQGATVRAVTAWAILGSTDWDSLVTRLSGHYEAGFFDIRSEPLRPTALVQVARDLATRGVSDHPLLATPGWWASAPQPRRVSTAPLMLVGATGTLGREFVRTCARRGIPVVAFTRAELDIRDPEAVRAAVHGHRPWAMVNAAGYVRVDEAERDPVTCRRVNAIGPAILAMVCRKAGVRLLTFSSDLVFDGGHQQPYLERDTVAPLNIYGQSKAEGERRVLALNPSALVVRTSAFFGPSDESNFVTRALSALASDQSFRAPNDVTVSPTYVPDVVGMSLDLLIDHAHGVWHLANVGAVTWFELAQLAADIAGVRSERLESCSAAALDLPAPRPRYSVLGSDRGHLMPQLANSVERYVHERRLISAVA